MSVLREDYQSFASRELDEYEVAYLFIDGIAERLHPGSRREAVLAPASGVEPLGGEDTFDWGVIKINSSAEITHDLLWGEPMDSFFSGVLMDHSVFRLAGIEVADGQPHGAALMFGDWHQTAPSGVGRVKWRGHAIAVNSAGVESWGTAVLDIDDLVAPAVVLSELPRDFTWSNVLLRQDEVFEAPDESMLGSFFSPRQEEVACAFEQGEWLGAFGGTKE